jgi:hypothetical protein
MAANCRPEEVGEGVVDNADDGLAVVAEAEGDADGRVAVDEVCGAVDGVDDECWGGGKGVARFICFFADEAVGVLATGTHNDLELLVGG